MNPMLETLHQSLKMLCILDGERVSKREQYKQLIKDQLSLTTTDGYCVGIRDLKLQSSAE